MSIQMLLVTGATGDTRGATVEQMLACGHHVRALAHLQAEMACRASYGFKKWAKGK
jgi:hypothetical protein